MSQRPSSHGPRSSKHPIPSAIVPSVRPAALTPAQVAREFRRRLDAGARLLPLGTARSRPGQLLAKGYVPRARLELFAATYYLTQPRQNEEIRFFVAYVVLGAQKRIHPRIFYKDVSLTWRSASHYIKTGHDVWIGKGDVQLIALPGGFERVESDEGTTDLPLEIQSALEQLLRLAKRVPRDDAAVRLILHGAPRGRIEAYRDFTGPRRRAAADARNLVNRGRPVARFTRRNDPSSLRFVRGFAPDFRGGILERGELTSRLYGGRLRRFRIASQNRRVQYQFMAGPRQVWITSLQAATTEVSSYGVRTIDVPVDEDLLIPGYEYHFADDPDDPDEIFSQIPAGFAGEPSEVDGSRVDASPWLDRMPVIREFRRVVLGASG